MQFSIILINSVLLSLALGFNYIRLSDKLSLGFEFNLTSARFSFICDAGWCGIGFGTDMIHTDMIVVMANNNGKPPIKMDLFSIAEASPPSDESLGGRDDLVLEDWSYTNTGFTAVISRLLATGDTFDYIIRPNSEIDLICATQKKNDWSKHDFKVHYKINLDPDDMWLDLVAEDTKTSKIFHRSLMLILWNYAVPIGIAFARYFKWVGHLWFVGHLICTVPAIWMTWWNSSKKYKETKPTMPIINDYDRCHDMLGLVLLSLLMAEGLLGIFSIITKWYGKNAYFISYTRKLHQFIGWALYIAGILNNGIYDLQLIYDYSHQMDLVFLFFIVFLLVLLESRHRLSPFLPFMNFFPRKKQLETSHLKVIEDINENGREYVFFDEYVLDISTFQYSHPGGATLFKNIKGEDIGKYMVGCSNKNFLNPYTHSPIAMKIVDYLSINTIPYPENFLINKNNSNQNNMIWRMAKKRKISHSTYIITFKSREYELNPMWEKAEWLGKHFKASILVKSSLTNKYTMVSRYYSCIFVDLDDWKQEVSDEGHEVIELTRNRAKGLSFIIKIYPGGVMTQYLKTIAKNEKIALKGPLGPGLSVDNLSGDFLAVAGGTGLVPFLDLVHYLWVNRNNPHEFKLTLIVSFRRKKDVFAYDLISATERTVDSNIFKFVLIISSEKEKPCLRELLFEHGKQKPKKIWICGPSGFNSFVAETLMKSGVESQNIIIM